MRTTVSQRAELRRVAAEKAQERSRNAELRKLEHQLDIACRLRDHAIDFGLAWFEEGRLSIARHACMGCRRPRCRRWVGVWYEFEIAAGRAPYAICQTEPLCATCVIRRQKAEEHLPIWRPKGWRAAA